MMQWLKHAFAVDKPGPVQPTPEQHPIIERLCHEIIRRHMAGPAIVLLESLRPLNFVGAQALHFFAPFVSTLVDTDAHRHLAAFLEHRGSIDYLCERIDQLDVGRKSANEKPEDEQTTADSIELVSSIDTESTHIS